MLVVPYFDTKQADEAQEHKDLTREQQGMFLVPQTESEVVRCIFHILLASICFYPLHAPKKCHRGAAVSGASPGGTQGAMPAGHSDRWEETTECGSFAHQAILQMISLVVVLVFYVEKDPKGIQSEVFVTLLRLFLFGLYNYFLRVVTQENKLFGCFLAYLSLSCPNKPCFFFAFLIWMEYRSWHANTAFTC